MRPPLRPALAVACAVLAAVPLTRAAAPRPEAPRPPNILFIVADDLMPAFGAYGNAASHTPRLDALAASGVVFDRAYCQLAVCAPSRASFLTGFRPDTLGIYDLDTPVSSLPPLPGPSLPAVLKAAGYATVSRGKIYHHGKREDASQWTLPPGGAPPNKTELGGKPNLAVRVLPDDQPSQDERLSDLAIATLDQLAADPDRPWFLAVGFYKPHLPFAAPRRHWERVDPAKIPAPPPEFAADDVPRLALHQSAELRNYDDIPDSGPVPPEQARALRHGYHACVSLVDEQIGRLLDRLVALGIDERTVVVVTGDHGFHLGDHGLWGKHSNFENATRVPLLVRAPGLARGARAPGLVEMVDFLPTLAALAGLPAPEHAAGASFLPQLRDPSAPGKDAAFSQYPRPEKNPRAMGYSIRTERWRYTEWLSDWRSAAPEVVGRELYDHAADPAEAVNLAADPARAAEVAALSARLAAARRATPPVSVSVNP